MLLHHILSAFIPCMLFLNILSENQHAFWLTVTRYSKDSYLARISSNDYRTFLFFNSEVGVIVGSGIKLTTIAKNMTPAKNCITKKVDIDHQNKHDQMGGLLVWADFSCLIICVNLMSRKTIAYPKVPFQKAN